MNTPEKQLIEAALFAVDKPLTIKQLQESVLASFQLKKSQVSDILNELDHEYKDRGVLLQQTALGYQFITNPALSDQLSCLWTEKPAKYSRALLETLALIAYKQPITRGEIEHLRGVAVSSHIIKTMTERQWIKIVGHKEIPGKPALYGTTNGFLDYFGLTSLSQLPQLTENQLDAAISSFEQQ
ncbi:SMC-Scp complex subunit ScpB [Psychrobium sp. 1_MG-2023]|uniref:SMC-Scp complex subunit ScpB n=1 Tax=Psychrobium sp. 1_MG-2023 TaxID=3062624 RepID=UPI000C34FAE2|nr:SMC-Scp complex subunit ScpB [Psychrobium sp. 1_MG-2023]MDP2560240.1 SMC-Scp complex subunit ScpB [Psychrobium sp. 1_MG-2023]PKF57050.1 SMC-Scp complex subunit ScpB [Alteromonadales bacterium alter-6D02]